MSTDQLIVMRKADMKRAWLYKSEWKLTLRKNEMFVSKMTRPILKCGAWLFCWLYTLPNVFNRLPIEFWYFYFFEVKRLDHPFKSYSKFHKSTKKLWILFWKVWKIKEIIFWDSWPKNPSKKLEWACRSDSKIYFRV